MAPFIPTEVSQFCIHQKKVTDHSGNHYRMPEMCKELDGYRD